MENGQRDQYKLAIKPELDVSQVLNPKEYQEYQEFFVIARWIIEVGRVEIFYEVLLLSSHLDMPQKGHMEALMGIFVYLDKAYGKTIIIDPMIPKVNDSMETETNWIKSIYSEDNQDYILANTTEPLGNTMPVNFFVDTSHSG